MKKIIMLLIFSLVLGMSSALALVDFSVENLPTSVPAGHVFDIQVQLDIPADEGIRVANFQLTPSIGSIMSAIPGTLFNSQGSNGLIAGGGWSFGQSAADTVSGLDLIFVTLTVCAGNVENGACVAGESGNMVFNFINTGAKINALSADISTVSQTEEDLTITIAGACVPDCAGKECGSDGCDGSCGTCADGTSCNSEGACIAEDVDFCADYTQFGDFYDSINQGLNDFSGLADISACFKRMDDVYGIDKYFLDSKSSSNKIECVEIYKGIPIIKRDFNGVDWFQIIYMASNNIYFDVSYYFFNGCDGYVNGDTYKRHFTTLESLKNCIDNPTQLINLNSYTYADINCQAPVCVPQCDGKECGSDGCGGSCGTCADGTCNAAGVCESPTTKISGPLNTLILRTDCILNSTCIQGDAEYGYVESKLNQVARIAKALRSYYQEVTLCIGDGNCQTVQPNQEGMTDEVITLTNGMIAALEPETTTESVVVTSSPLSATANIANALKNYYATE